MSRVQALVAGAVQPDVVVEDSSSLAAAVDQVVPRCLEAFRRPISLHASLSLYRSLSRSLFPSSFSFSLAILLAVFFSRA